MMMLFTLVLMAQAVKRDGNKPKKRFLCGNSKKKSMMLLWQHQKIHRILDEAPSAYKNIESVMEQQKDLVDIAYRLEPLAVVKG